MKIKETIERECCQEKDLRAYAGIRVEGDATGLQTCCHCGQLWGWVKSTEPDPGGGWQGREFVKLRLAIKH